MRFLTFLIAGCCAMLWRHADSVLAVENPRILSREQADFFEKRVRPVLVARCFSCHGPKKQESGLRLDSRQALLQGGERGPAAKPGDVPSSLLLRALRRDGDLKMPPQGKLKPAEITALQTWVKMGLPWPTDPTTTTPSPRKSLGGSEISKGSQQRHWAFQPLRQPAIPSTRESGWARTPIDCFIQAELETRGLSPSSRADRRTLIRRATFDLLGLPPTREEVADFETDASPAAFAKVIERLLASPHYGERWGRRWLDVARYADNKGYVFFEEKTFPWAYTYRDFVVRSLNEDLPYDRFVLYQLAADLLDLGDDKRPLAAMGFLTLGGRFMNNTHDVIDDRIDVISRGLMGLTVTCARCHDHKYDPIRQADYYALYGVLRSSMEPQVPPLFQPPPNTEQYKKFTAELAKRKKKLLDFVDQKHAELVSSARSRAAEYLLAAHAARNQPRTEDFMLLTGKGELNPTMIVRWIKFLEKTRQTHDPIWKLWHALADVSERDFSSRAERITKKFIGPKTTDASANASIHPLVREAFNQPPPQSMKEVAQRYGDLLNRVERTWQDLLKTAAAEKAIPPQRLKNPAQEQLRQVFYGDEAPPDVPKVLDWGFLSLLPDRPAQGVFKKLLKELETWSMNGPGAPPRAMVLQERAKPYQPRIFLRGNPNRLGAAVPRQFIKVLNPGRKPFRHGGGRLELAQAIIDPANPLTARVIVNRVWMGHFSQPLVETPSDFGLRSEAPVQLKLLDYLASTFIRRGWSLKDLHRRIMNSAVYQQNSRDRPECRQVDAENRLLWKMNRRRLEFEALRDALLSVSGALDRRIGGPPGQLFGQKFVPRRSIYGFVDRMNLPSLLSTFDFPNPASSSPRRVATTVPPQALFLMNHPFVNESARRAAGRWDVANTDNISAKIQRIYESIFARGPTETEQLLSRRYLGEKPTAQRLTAFIHGLMMTNEFVYID